MQIPIAWQFRCQVHVSRNSIALPQVTQVIRGFTVDG